MLILPITIETLVALISFECRLFLRSNAEKSGILQKSIGIKIFLKYLLIAQSLMFDGVN